MMRIREMYVIGLINENMMYINKDEPQVTNMGEIDIISLNDEDAMHIDEDKPKITNMGEMDIVGFNDDTAMNIDEDEDDQIMIHIIICLGDMNIIGLNDNLDGASSRRHLDIKSIGINLQLYHLLKESGDTPELPKHNLSNPQPPDVSLYLQTSPRAMAKQKTAILMENIEILKQDKVTKNRKIIYYVLRRQAICCMVIIYTPTEDLITENNWHCEERDSGFTTELDHEELEDMLRKLKQGADSAHGDNTGTLKDLMASWVNVEYYLTLLIRTDNKASSVMHVHQDYVMTNVP
ncbi:hypothetical protein DFH29DRAFT_871226 [Suillus ampliporus]|nr:hypothetical protein DFH29DRAFT_871226 [Suillus ampliporus]